MIESVETQRGDEARVTKTIQGLLASCRARTGRVLALDASPFSSTTPTGKLGTRTTRFLGVPLILALLLAPLPVMAAPQSPSGGIVVDGIVDVAYGPPLATDPAGDGYGQPNLDLLELYVAEDAAYYYVAFTVNADIGVTDWGKYVLYVDTTNDAAGATSDAWGRNVLVSEPHKPEFGIYGWVNGPDYDASHTEVYAWAGGAWSRTGQIAAGNIRTGSPSVVEWQLAKAALCHPEAVWLEMWSTGDSEGDNAQDTLHDPPDDWNADDWDATAVLSVATRYAPPRPPADWYVRGDFNGWGIGDPMNDDGLDGDATPGDGIYTAQVTVAPAGRYEFKVASGAGPASYPGANSWFDITEGDGVVRITFDTNSYSDGWQPATNIIGVSTEPGTWTAVGDWQGWKNADPVTAMMPVGGGIYEFTTPIAVAGQHEYKAVKTGSPEWDAIGSDGRNVHAAALAFETVEPGQKATFRVNAEAGWAQVEVEPAAPGPRPDDDVWWDGLGHNSRDDLYRVPWGAVTTGTPVTLRFRTYHNDVSEVTLRVWSTADEAQTLYPMAPVATTQGASSGGARYGYDYWQATIPAQERPTILTYRFVVRDGGDEDYYEDDGFLDGGWGMAYEASPDNGYQIAVYEPDFVTPEWMKNAIVYQIFPDRFSNAREGDDVGARDPAIYGQQPLKKGWDELPEGYCRAYVGVDCQELPQGRDFYGGDLQGIVSKLPYLQDLGVTVLYLNPIFAAPSNHLYDTADYYQIDPYFGDISDFGELVHEAEEHGLRIILDGVFNHTSSDSVYFDRYGRYPAVGAYEGQDSVSYDWYTFHEWPDEYSAWRGFDSLPVLTEVPAVKDLIYGAGDSVARYWIQQGASGWRLDVAPDKSHEFWQEFRLRVKDADADAVIVGEIWDDAGLWLLGNEFDSTMNYRFRRALLGFVNGDTSDPNQGFVQGLNPDQFDSVLQSIKEDYPPPAYGAAMNLVGSHDTARILWALTPGQRNRKDREFNAANLAQGKEKLKLLAILQMTMPGAPAIYYGDEVGLTGDTDPDDRRPFPWDDVDAYLQAHYRTLIRLRREHSFLRTGSFERLYTHNGDGTYAYGRKDASGAAVVAVNRDTAAHNLTINLSGYVPEGTVLEEALNGGSQRVTGGQVTVRVDGRGGVVLVAPAGTDLTPPEVPAGLTATTGDGIVDLVWDGVPGAAGYALYRSLVAGGGYKRLNDSLLEDVVYRDGAAVNGQPYHYVVTAVDEWGNESGRSAEVEALPNLVIGWANLQWPPVTAHTLSALNPTENIYGQVRVNGHTGQPGATAGLWAQVGFGPDGSDPHSNSDWHWVDASFRGDVGDNDEFVGQLLPETAGAYDYAYRFSTTGGRMWLYADLDGAGNGYDPAQAGDLTVDPASDTMPPAAPRGLHVVCCSPSLIRLAWDGVSDTDLLRYEVLRAGASSGPYEKVADVLAPTTEYTDRDVSLGATYHYVLLAADSSFNRSLGSNRLAATAQARQVQVTFHVTLPDRTPDGDDVYVSGNWSGWDPGGTLMVRPDPGGLAATATLALDEGMQIEYKYTRGSWDTVEKGAGCAELQNRVVTVVYGTDGRMTLGDTVSMWRDVGGCP